MTKNNVINRPISEVVSINSETFLDQDDLDQIIVASGAAAYNITLPNALLYPGRTIHIVVQTTSNALVTIVTDSGNILAGVSESYSFISNGTTWQTFNASWVHTYFQATPAANQTLTDAVPAQLVLANSTVFGGTFSSNTFTCLYPGRYEFGCTVKLQAVTNATVFQASMFYNGATIADQQINIPAGLQGTITFSPVQQQMAATDTMYIQVTQTSGANETVDDAQNFVFFNGKRINYF